MRTLTAGSPLPPPPRPSATPDPRRTALRLAFLAGAIADAAAVIPMLFPSLVGSLWGLHDLSPGFRLALGYGAALMAGWTALLAWASRRPIERRFVAPLTVLVILGLVATELVAVFGGTVAPPRMAPTWALQAVLLAAFITAYHRRARQRVP